LAAGEFFSRRKIRTELPIEFPLGHFTIVSFVDSLFNLSYGSFENAGTVVVIVIRCREKNTVYFTFFQSVHSLSVKQSIFETRKMQTTTKRIRTSEYADVSVIIK